MKIQFKRDVLLKVLQRIQGIVEKRHTMPILSNILLIAKPGKIEIIATDLEVSIKDLCDAVVTEEGIITINAKKLFEIIKELTDEKIDIYTEEGGKIVIKGGKSQFSILGRPVEEFPSFPNYDEKQLFKIAPQILKDMIEKTVFALSMDETRYNINGVFVEKKDVNVKMVATDGHRLSLIEREIEWPAIAEKGVILPRKGILELKKFLDDINGAFFLGFTENNAVVKKDDTVLIIRLIDGEFPEYNQIIPKGNDKIVKLKTQDFLRSLKRVSLLSLEKGRGVKFGFSQNRLELSSSNPELGEAKEDIEIDYNNDAFEVGFNATYLMEALGIIGGDEISFELKDRESPAILRPAIPNNYTYIIMPMRI